uniref:Uncharacterized protein n=1 Tax=Sphaerodactylus townsendi TaxID=933632 RepID=A0ACB8FI85_9SAUR
MQPHNHLVLMYELRAIIQRVFETEGERKCCVPPAFMSAVAKMELLIPSNSAFQISILEVYKLNIAKEYKSCFFLAAVLWLGFVCPQNISRPPYACQCLKDIKDREDCGREGITAEQCTAKGCCFDATEPGVPWCFYPSGERASLQFAKKMFKQQGRMECGYPGITYKRCRRIGCCYDRKASDEPKCFHPPVNDGVQEKNVDTRASLQRNAKQDGAVSIHMLLAHDGAFTLYQTQD